MRKFKEIPFVEKEDFIKNICISENGCWIWKGRTRGKINPVYHVSGFGNSLSASRVSYSIYKGQPSIDLVIGKTCGDSMCVNPEHLEERTELSNFHQKESSPVFKKANSLFCKNGHELNNENTYTPPGQQNVRKCRTCRANADRKRKANKK